MIRIDAITDRRDFRRIGEEWEEVLAVSGSSTYTMAHGWLSPWSETIGRSRDLLILRVRRGREAIGFVPLMFDPAGGALSYRVLHFLPEWMMADTSDLIIARDREEALEAVLEYLSRRTVCAELRLSRIPSYSPNLELLREYAAAQSDRTEFSVREETFRIEIGSRAFDEYIESTSKSFVRKDIARLKNRYLEREWVVRELGSEGLEAVLPTLARLHLVSQARSGRGSYYQDSAYWELLRRTARESALGRSIRIYLLEIEGEIAAVELGYLYGGTLYGRDTGFDNRFRRLSPSKFLMYEIVKRGFQERWTAYDQGPGAGHYKHYWGCARYKVYGITLTNGWGINAALRRLRNGQALTGVARPEVGVR